MRRDVVEFLAYATLDLFNFRSEEFYGISALGTDHVVVIASIEAVLEAGYAVMELNFRSQTTLHKQLERAVYGRVANRWVLLFD